MKNNRYKLIFTAFFFIVMGGSSLIAQNPKMNADSLFFVARAYAFNKNYQEAKDKCNTLLGLYPEYYDARVLLAKIYAWNQEYDSARSELEKILEKSKYSDAISAMIDVQNWSGNKQEAIAYCDLGSKNYPLDNQFHLKKAQILFELKEEGSAQREISYVLEQDPDNEEARKLLDDLKKITVLNKISIQYSYEYSKEPWERKWNLVDLEYKRQTRYGPVIGRVYMGDVVLDGESLFSKNTAYQYELEAYPVISSKNYAYLNYSYSNGDLFPKHRMGGEIYQKFLKTFELSAGLRYLQFITEEEGKNEVLIYTGTLGKYYRNYWFSFRPYFNTNSNGLSQSYYFTARRYLAIKDNFISLEIGRGSSPDDPMDYGDNYDSSFKLKMNKIQLSWQQLVFDRVIFYVIGAYQHEEYQAGSYRDDYSIKFQIGYNF